MKSLFIAALAAAAAAFATGCSGAPDTDLLADSGGVTPTEDAGGLPQNDAAPTEPDATTTVDASEGHDATTTVDAAPDVPVGPPDSKIQCGQQACSAQNEICCWHQGSTQNPYECVSNIGDCSGTTDVPITCSSHENCDSQGNTGDSCCATGGNFGAGACYGYDVASVVACKPSCDVTDYEIGCSVQKQNCTDGISTCVVSKCTDPGVTMCY